MRLTSLEIKGFKSFGDKIVIHFAQGVTSVVGPNGSGKSNVVDAIRWVLGEQKIRMLRSEKMENIIFNGTKNRKPSSFAETKKTNEPPLFKMARCSLNAGIPYSITNFLVTISLPVCTCKK